MKKASARLLLPFSSFIFFPFPFLFNLQQQPKRGPALLGLAHCRFGVAALSLFTIFAAYKRLNWAQLTGGRSFSLSLWHYAFVVI